MLPLYITSVASKKKGPWVNYTAVGLFKVQLAYPCLPLLRH